MDRDISIPRILRRPVLWLLVLGAVLVYAAYAFVRTPVEVLPQFDFPQIGVTAHLPGTTATELERLVVAPLESQILTLTNIAGVRSTMGNGTVEIDVRFREGSGAQSDLQAVNGAIDRARAELPAQIDPVAQIMGNAVNEVADYSARIPAGVAPAQVQRALMADVVPALRAIPGVQFVHVYGAGDEALWIQPNLGAMQRYGVPVTALAQAVREQVLLEPAGFVTMGHSDVLIEARSLPVHIAELERIPVPAPSGPVPLGALAKIVRSAEPTHNAVALDAHPSVALTIIKQSGASTLAVTRAVQATLDASLSQLPTGVSWIRTYSQGHVVQLVGADLGRNLLIGAVLAVLVLLWVLGAGRAIVTLALSIPLSLALAIALLHAFGEDLNLMTLGALTVAVGLLADDAIIVLESIYHRWECGDAHWAGIWNGVKAIAVPDITGTLTNVAIYVPLLFVGGLVGLFFIPFSLAMILALLASLLVSLTLTPLGLGFLNARAAAGTRSGQRLLQHLQAGNERLFAWVSRAPRASLAITFAVLLLSLAGLVLVPINFLPLPNEGVLLESFTLPPGSSLLDAREAVDTITGRLLREPTVAHVSARIGSSASTSYTEPAYAGEIQVVLKPGVSVNALDAIGERIQRVSKLSGVQFAIDTPTIERVGESLSGLPQPFVIHVFGSSVARLRELAQEITARLQRISALTDVFDNDGYPVTQLQIEPDAQALGANAMTPATLYAQLNPLVNGEVVTRVPEGNVPLDLYLRLADASQRGVDELGALPIRTPGGWTPLSQLARLSLVSTPNQMQHVAGARALDILATPNGALGSTDAAARRALEGLRLPPGYRIEFGGLAAQIERAALGLALAALTAFAIMIGILLLQFDGLLIPAILLLEIPLALTGGTIALVISGVGLNATGMIGFLTLIGVGLRHSIVLLDRVRHNETAGMPVEHAVREAISVRFRPIVLTAVTAMLGMLPTALGLGQGAAPEQGLAVVILGGLLWSAVRSTNLIPALYLYWRRKQLARLASEQAAP
ncbi:AcrB/AcrD/AcrF family protein [Trinickia dabaoshanensis]|uniref:AcrB/AcrD/AcrF family protein n=1 Tax=Trinickia dabaoshanensis TaxID=564714 RepID=A0A2N7VBM7_9BURK|nr:efflux RND transporter permease subunit [Trinickia dabaoshanensis]PMS14571.1 AcrB/AcrD/AcrF family protein [Trinickia dabaoshanensis]